MRQPSRARAPPSCMAWTSSSATSRMAAPTSPASLFWPGAWQLHVSLLSPSGVGFGSVVENQRSLYSTGSGDRPCCWCSNSSQPPTCICHAACAAHLVQSKDKPGNPLVCRLHAEARISSIDLAKNNKVHKEKSDMKRKSHTLYAKVPQVWDLGGQGRPGNLVCYLGWHTPTSMCSGRCSNIIITHIL